MRVGAGGEAVWLVEVHAPETLLLVPLRLMVHEHIVLETTEKKRMASPWVREAEALRSAADPSGCFPSKLGVSRTGARKAFSLSRVHRAGGEEGCRSKGVVASESLPRG